MRDQRENKETRGILADVPRVVIPLGDAVAHNRAGDAPDEMHEQGEKLLRIPRKHRPRDVVDGHRGDGNELYGVGAERVFLCEGHGQNSFYPTKRFCSSKRCSSLRRQSSATFSISSCPKIVILPGGKSALIVVICFRHMSA